VCCSCQVERRDVTWTLLCSSQAVRNGLGPPGVRVCCCCSSGWVSWRGVCHAACGVGVPSIFLGVGRMPWGFPDATRSLFACCASYAVGRPTSYGGCVHATRHYGMMCVYVWMGGGARPVGAQTLSTPSTCVFGASCNFIGVFPCTRGLFHVHIHGCRTL
jgi:hypothetical protein